MPDGFPDNFAHAAICDTASGWHHALGAAHDTVDHDESALPIWWVEMRKVNSSTCTTTQLTGSLRLSLERRDCYRRALQLEGRRF